VPRGARPNPGNPVTGSAVPRESRPPASGGGGGGYYPGYYPPYGGGGYYGGYYPYYPYWGYPGLYFYSPFWWGYGGWPAYGNYGYGAEYGYAGSYPSGYYYGNAEEYMRGSLKLKVKPREAEVLVDGYFVGRVDDFDGTFQELDLKPGSHRVEIRLEGFEPISFDVTVDPRQTITYRGELKKTK